MINHFNKRFYLTYNDINKYHTQKKKKKVFKLI